jgi:hypothetical protein
VPLSISNPLAILCHGSCIKHQAASSCITLHHAASSCIKLHHPCVGHDDGGRGESVARVESVAFMRRGFGGYGGSVMRVPISKNVP